MRSMVVLSGDARTSYGEVFVWASSSWRSVFRRPFRELVANFDLLDDRNSADFEAFEADIRSLLEVGFDVVAE